MISASITDWLRREPEWTQLELIARLGKVHDYGAYKLLETRRLPGEVALVGEPSRVWPAHTITPQVPMRDFPWYAPYVLKVTSAIAIAQWTESTPQSRRLGILLSVFSAYEPESVDYARRFATGVWDSLMKTLDRDLARRGYVAGLVHEAPPDGVAPVVSESESGR